MTGLVDWAVERSRMILVLILISIGAGVYAYLALPKEGEPNIDVPVLFISAPLQGISANDAESLIVKPLEDKLSDLEGLDFMSATAAEGYGGVLLQFEFGWDKAATIADVRARVDEARAEMPAEVEEPSINEINLSAFPVIVASLSGDLPERTLLRVAKDLQREVEALPSVLEAGLAGHRDELFEVIVDPTLLEAYDVTAQELLTIVANNNRLVAAGAIETESSSFAVKLPGKFRTTEDIYSLPVKVTGDRVVTVRDLATIRRTFEDAEGTARYNGETTVALQIKKRSGEPIIDMIAEVKERIASVVATWPEPLRATIRIDYSMDQSVQVDSMVGQLESSVLTAVLLVMLVVVLTLGMRSSLLVGIAIPCSFMLTFALLAAFDMSVTNIVMFGLILAVGMLVDGAIVVTEYADRRLAEGAPPREAYAEAARRMFWPIISSTATTLCAFLPMLFWPGMPGQFMGWLPITLIFVLSASLVVALIFLPVMGGLIASFLGWINGRGAALRAQIGRLGAGLLAAGLLAATAFLAPLAGAGMPVAALVIPGCLALFTGLLCALRGAVARGETGEAVAQSYRRTPFGRFVSLMVANPVMPFVIVGATIWGLMFTFSYFGEHNNGVEFFVKTEPERAIVYVRARGNLSLNEKDRLLGEVERRVLDVDGVSSVFAFAGAGGLELQGGAQGPKDSVGQVQIELALYNERRDGFTIMEEIEERIAGVPGVITELAVQKDGPQQGKAIQLRLESRNWDRLVDAAAVVNARFRSTDGLINVDDTRPLPGIDWTLEVDREAAGRFGADIANIGILVSLVTRGALLDTVRPEDSDDEIDMRARFPEEDRVVSTLDQLKIRTQTGLVPLSNFVTRAPKPQLSEISRRDGVRYIVVQSDVDEAGGVNANAKIAEIQSWLDDGGLTAAGFGDVKAVFQGDQEEQSESQQFLMFAFAASLMLMFAILLAQFNSIYNSLLVLTAVVMSVGGVLIGMLVMGQTFSIIMTGTGIVALAGIVVNNNIVLIDTFQDFRKRYPPIEAIIRTAEQRIRPVLLTTITTMAGLAPMMFAMSIDFGQLGVGISDLLAAGAFTSAGWAAFVHDIVSFGAPTALWWVQLATAVVWGLGVATFLTLLVTPSALAIRVWITTFMAWIWLQLRLAAARSLSSSSELVRDRALRRAARRLPLGDVNWAMAGGVDAGGARLQAPAAPEEEGLAAGDDHDLKEVEREMRARGEIGPADTVVGVAPSRTAAE